MRRTTNLTHSREAWLRTLLKGPAVFGKRGSTGFDCRKLGWTEWVRDDDGHLTDLEQITDLGREVLRLHERPATGEEE